MSSWCGRPRCVRSQNCSWCVRIMLRFACITTRTECICAIIPFTKDWNTTSGTTSPGRGSSMSIWCHTW